MGGAARYPQAWSVRIRFCLSIALDRKEANIKHDAIYGFRPATTMSYNVPDAGELADLKPGDLITAGSGGP